MDLKTFLRSIPVPDRDSFAERCDTTSGHLRNVAYGDRTCSESLAINIERESGGQVRCESLCPGVDWKYIRGSASRFQTNRKCG
jgi:DNA-binding transcriptional regulator YdaS (Cro superfamily)